VSAPTEPLREAVQDVLPTARVTAAHGLVTADVPRALWVESATRVRDDPCLDGSFFDLLTVVDQLPDGLDVVLRVWSVGLRHAVHLRTSCPRDDARVPTLVPVFAGAGWHERAAAELFGVAFDGSPDTRPLLLPPGGDERPLRKEHLLAARAAPWPGAQDPAHSGEGGRPSRRRLSPPGAPPAPGRRP
jgi:NADH-quinone oxidoreductase subunit C